MQIVTGAPSFGFWIKDYEDDEILFNKLNAFDKINFMISTTSKDDCIKEKGIVACHAYTIISTFKTGNDLLLKLRNPWGYFEWKGIYSDDSNKWTNELKELVKWKSADDGVFFMTIHEFRQQFQHISVCMYRDDYTLKTIKIPQVIKNNLNFFYIFLKYFF